MGKKVIDGRFLVLRDLGDGATGEVVEATALKDTPYTPRGARLAIKLYKPWVLAERNQAFRIERELRHGLNISSPHIVKSYELGSDGDVMYLVMELLEGVNLRQWMAAHHKRSFSEFTEIATGIVKGIHALHSHDLIHRDIKPENIMITARGPVILDLGVLREIKAGTVITGKQFLGTIKYAAPEYLFGEEYQHDIDVYGFGLIMFELATGKPPFDDSLNWSKLILKKDDEYIWNRWSFRNISNVDYCNLRERAFIDALISGSIGHSGRRYQLRARRFSSIQLHTALESRVWESTFLYPIDSWNKPHLECWPNIPADIENDVAEFIARYFDQMSSAVPEILWKVAQEDNGDFHELLLDDLTPERSALFDWMLKSGLVFKDNNDYGDEVYDRLTELSWQLLLRGIIPS